jgi:hypothetical protein
LVDENEDYDPMTEYGFKPQDLSSEEEYAISGSSLDADDDDGEPLVAENIW